jgi:hypothetical protein
VKAKKLLAALGVLVMLIPGVAFAHHESKVTQEIVEGHSVYATVLENENIGMAAIAGIAAKRTTIGGVLWFNNQELLPSQVASEVAAGAYVLATEAGDDDPAIHIAAGDLEYADSYQFMDPNDRVWIVDRYTYEICSVDQGGSPTPVPCDGAHAASTSVDLDKDGHADDVSGESLSTEGDVTVDLKSVYVVEIGDTAKDLSATCDPLAVDGGGLKDAAGVPQDYNFVLLVRMDTLGDVVADGKAHGASSTDLKGDGNSHAALSTAPADHTHDTASIDLWFSEDRPASPGSRTLFFPEDVDGASAPCAA